MSVYFRQILAGPMQNFVYAIGCERTRQCVLVDPAWAVDSLLDTLDADGMTLSGALITHYHPDHCGGSMFGLTVEGLPRLMESRPVPVHVNEYEADGLKQVTGLSESDLVRQSSGNTLQVGDIELRFLHTPGHTPGSQCFLINDCLVSGDTLFIDGCGRVDLPGGDPEEMYRTLTQRLAKLPDQTILYPGHNYGNVPSSEMGTVKQTNHYMKVPTLEAWLSLMGR